MITKEIIIKNISKNGKYITKNFLNENSCTQQECFDILYPEKIKKCKYCNNITTFVNFSFGYKDICDCKECKHKHRIETTRKTCLEKYGVENISQLKEVKEKKEKTFLERYGVKDFLNSELNRKNMYDEKGVHKSRTKEVNEKRNKTLIEKYGSLDTFLLNEGRIKSNSKEGREKAKDTLMKNYGVSSTRKLEKTKDSIKKTCLERYGVENFSQTEEFKEKCKKSCLEKYGVEWFTQSEEYKKSCTETSINKYNSKHYLSSKQRKDLEIQKGNWIPDEERSECEKYYLDVWRETFNQPLEFLENYEKRGRIDLNPEAYHIDHQFSIIEGFKQNIDPKIIGNIVNLKMLPAKENCSKKSKCSITKEELIKRYEK